MIGEETKPDFSRANLTRVDLNGMEIKQSGLHRTRKLGVDYTPINEDMTSAADEVMRSEDAADPKAAQLNFASLRLRATIQFLLEGLDASTDRAMQLHADIIRIVIGEGTPPRITALAKVHGLTKAAVSLRCRSLLRRLGLTPSRFMRPEREVNAMRVASLVRQSGIKLSAQSIKVQDRNRRSHKKPYMSDTPIRNLLNEGGSGRPAGDLPVIDPEKRQKTQGSRVKANVSQKAHQKHRHINGKAIVK